jgi:hypothetical protein
MQRFKRHIIAKHGGGQFDQIPITATPDRKYDDVAARRYLPRARPATSLLPLDELAERLRTIGVRPFLIDELVRRARRNRAAQSKS